MRLQVKGKNVEISPSIREYAERKLSKLEKQLATETQVEVFVRDRGSGFDPQTIPADRQGVRSSILDRMTRHGGTAEVRSSPGSGTEVRLKLPREEETS